MPDDGLAERVLRSSFGGRDEGQQFVLARSTLGADDIGDPRLALGEGAGLVEHDDADLLESLERLGVPEEHAVLGALPGTDHDRGRRREAERARAGDDQDGDRVDQGQVERRLRAEQVPDGECERGGGKDDRHEDAGDGIGQALDRCT